MRGVEEDVSRVLGTKCRRFLVDLKKVLYQVQYKRICFNIAGIIIGNNNHKNKKIGAATSRFEKQCSFLTNDYNMKRMNLFEILTETRSNKGQYEDKKIILGHLKTAKHSHEKWKRRFFGDLNSMKRFLRKRVRFSISDKKEILAIIRRTVSPYTMESLLSCLVGIS